MKATKQKIFSPNRIEKEKNNLQNKKSMEKKKKKTVRINVGKQSKKGFQSLVSITRADLRQQLAKNKNNHAKKQRKRSA